MAEKSINPFLMVSYIILTITFEFPPILFMGKEVTRNLCNLFMISHPVDGTQRTQIFVCLSPKAVFSLTTQ